MSKRNAVLLLGSNIGDRKKNIEIAISLIEKKIGKIEKKTFFLKTKPVEFVSNNYFCNIAVSIKTVLSPHGLLEKIKDIEKMMGRTKDSIFWGEYQDRIIDIDIVNLGDLVFKSNRLELPHSKHTYERSFSKELLEDLKSKI
ncbi:2-amino-4-hydroxy-6-hydroxymethyldihydropteridine diphosphokinase [Riemerella columbipharyngis]|uniref:2-amino-4-hydroxy-6-hydroxymethyldihydropteridine pyrophosphokinase n=1 Tax=Riemerella columbipharyngis TaxID=1071918 RepID=A0A1G7EF67_9FLAO|nr:2-amino-4-hydroxy-6-hydroxymethyldihydropteridine diphosphokinase [Riemerella columbipharyngis]SDE62283.1 2-amino-4-hydroxy-6-hydroxymethyldihydropteridinediphosphokinase [Riemerella columbipharyngis]